jgi:osmotically-inducible protein OsmY
VPDLNASLIERVRQSLRAEPRLGGDEAAIRLSWEADALVMDGEVSDIAAKKLALERAAACPGVAGIVDRLRTTPARRMDDQTVLRLVLDALDEEPAFGEFTIRPRDLGQPAGTSQWPSDARGVIEVAVADGVVTLDGRVPGLDHKRLAGVLAWWVPGSRDVVNGTGVEPPEDDNDGALVDAVRIVLEKDPLVTAGQVRVQARDCVVTLTGLVADAAEREMAERDAWYVFAVDRVDNQIEVSRKTWPERKPLDLGRDLAGAERKTSCRWCGRPATIGPIGIGNIEDALCVVCRGLSALHAGPIEDETAEPFETVRWRLHAIAVDAVNAWLGLRYALGPREQPFGCWWCARPGLPVVVSVDRPSQGPEAGVPRALFVAPVLCELCRELIGMSGEDEHDRRRLVDEARERLLSELGHEPGLAI